MENEKIVIFDIFFRTTNYCCFKCKESREKERKDEKEIVPLGFNFNRIQRILFVYGMRKFMVEFLLTLFHRRGEVAKFILPNPDDLSRLWGNPSGAKGFK